MPTESKQQTKEAIAAKLEGRRRVVIEGVKPEIDCGEFPIQRVVGETVAVEADVFADGHDAVAAQILYRRSSERNWRTLPMQPLGNDRWRAEFAVMELGEYRYTGRRLGRHLHHLAQCHEEAHRRRPGNSRRTYGR